MRTLEFKQVMLTTIIVLLLSCTVITGASQDNAEVLTSLERRMQKRISLDFRNTPIDDVIRVMAEQADVDIIKSPKVVGDVTTTLTDVPLAEALSNILAAHGYGFVATRNMIRIAPMDELTERQEMLTHKIWRINYANVCSVEKALKKFISKRGSISCNPGTSNVMVTDTESKIKAIDKFISEIDRITPQILVEARIYDITCTDRLDLGVEWTAGRNTSFGNSGADIATLTDPFMTGLFDSVPSKTNTMNGIFRFGWLNSAIDIDFLIKAQKQIINAKLLANPRVLVLDNEKAEIKIIREIPYQEITESAAGGTIGSTNFREVGVTLKVTPHVTRDEMIRLHVLPEFSVDAGDVLVGLVNESFPQPQVDRRSVESILLLKNRQTVVLGGLRKKEVSDQTNKVPLLGDLPVIGFIFKSKAEEAIFSEVIVFITPTIITNPELTKDEKQAYEETEFGGPCPKVTDVEEDGDCLWKNCKSK